MRKYSFFIACSDWVELPSSIDSSYEDFKRIEKKKKINYILIRLAEDKCLNVSLNQCFVYRRLFFPLLCLLPPVSLNIFPPLADELIII